MCKSIIRYYLEVELEHVRSEKYEQNIKLYGEDSNSCFICGKRIKNMDTAKWVHYLTNGNIVSTNEKVIECQGYFPVGTDCAKKLVLNFAFDAPGAGND